MPLEFDTRVLGFSPANALYLAKACAAAYADERRRPAAAAELGLAEGLTPFDVTEEGHHADYHGFVASTADMALLVFRGTESLDPWLTDAAVAQKPGYGGLVHKGFAEALDEAWEEVGPLLREHAEGRDLWVTGHGLGAALAVLAAARLGQQGREVEAVYTFGCPRVGNLAFYETYRTITYRLVNNNDVVAHVPAELTPVGGYHYFTYKHVGTLRYLDRHGLLDEGTSDWAAKKRLVREQLARNGQPPTQWFQDHLLAAYIEAIEKNV